MRSAHSSLMMSPSSRAAPPVSARQGMRHRRPWLAVWLLLATALMVGCAKQYHWYRTGCDCVNYDYCPPAPLPYSPYCTCPTPISTAYHSLLRSARQNPPVSSEDPTVPTE